MCQGLIWMYTFHSYSGIVLLLQFLHLTPRLSICWMVIICWILAFILFIWWTSFQFGKIYLSYLFITFTSSSLPLHLKQNCTFIIRENMLKLFWKIVGWIMVKQWKMYPLRHNSLFSYYISQHKVMEQTSKAKEH